MQENGLAPVAVDDRDLVRCALGGAAQEVGDAVLAGLAGEPLDIRSGRPLSWHYLIRQGAPPLRP